MNTRTVVFADTPYRARLIGADGPLPTVAIASDSAEVWLYTQSDRQAHALADTLRDIAGRLDAAVDVWFDDEGRS